MPKLASFNKDYTLDKLLRVLESQQQMHETLLSRELADANKVGEACESISRIFTELTRAMAQIAGVRWQESDARLIFLKGRKGLETVAVRYGCDVRQI
jgi:hypothetical protein